MISNIRMYPLLSSTMRFDPAKVREETRADFERAWNESVKYIAKPDEDGRYPEIRSEAGKSHPIFDTIARLREAYLNLGFEEAMNPLIIEDREIQRQFAHEALAVLDRCFYLAGLPRPNVGLGEDRIAKMQEILGNLTEDQVDTVRRILHAYKKGEIEGDDLVPDIAHKLQVEDGRVAVMLNEVFPEFKELTPIASNRTLRSHMTSGWFLTLQGLHNRRQPPVKLFSVDRCFRREQAEDATRLMTYYSASCVIMDPDVTVNHGKAVAEALLLQFGFERFEFRPDDKRSKYYSPGTQIEVYAYHPKLVGSNTKYRDGWVEVATFGIYSPTALAQYDIPMPVMNLGLGVERLAMILHDATDVRELTYPQFYGEWALSDQEIAGMISLEKMPRTHEGQEVREAIVNVCREHGGEPSPCEFKAWEGVLCGRQVEVWVVEPEENTRLCGPAYVNEVVVKDGDILAVPPTKKWEKTLEAGVRTGITFIDAFAALAAAEVEEYASREEEGEMRVRIVKSPGEINIRVDPVAARYITGHNKKIDVRGPMFTTARVKIIS